VREPDSRWGQARHWRAGKWPAGEASSAIAPLAVTHARNSPVEDDLDQSVWSSAACVYFYPLSGTTRAPFVEQRVVSRAVTQVASIRCICLLLCFFRLPWPVKPGPCPPFVHIFFVIYNPSQRMSFCSDTVSKSLILASYFHKNIYHKIIYFYFYESVF